MPSPLADILIGGLTEANKKRQDNQKLQRNLQNAIIKGQTAKQDAGENVIRSAGSDSAER